jgi:hypothetical protein
MMQAELLQRGIKVVKSASMVKTAQKELSRLGSTASVVVGLTNEPPTIC